MTPSIVIQAALFIGAVWAGARALRALPAYRVKAHTPRWWITLVMVLLAATLPMSVAYVGHGSLDAGNPRVSALTTLLLCTGLSVVVVGWRASPSRGRKRCPRCWYDMEGVAAERCPECGRGVGSARDLLRTRRSLSLVFIGATLVAVSYVTLRVTPMENAGWNAMVPATPMIVALPWLPDTLIYGGDASLKGRLAHGGLWPWQEKLLERRAVGVLQRSRDPEVLLRADHLIRLDRTDVCMSEEAVAALARYIEATEGSAGRLLPLVVRFPDELSPPVQKAALGSVLTVLRRGTGSEVDIAAHIAPLFTLHTEPVAEALGEPARHNAAAMVALAQLSRDSETAWRLYELRLTHKEDSTRRLAVMFAPHASARARAFRDVALDDPAEVVAIAAVRTFGGMLASPLDCPTVDRLADVAQRRPSLRYVVLSRIHSRSCVTEALLELYRTMLGSSDVMERSQAVIAISQHQPPLRSLDTELENVDTTGFDTYTGQALLKARSKSNAAE